MAVPKPRVPSSPANMTRLRSLLEMKGATNVVGGQKFDIPKVDLIQSMFRGSDATRSELRNLWLQLPIAKRQDLFVQMVEQMPSPKGGARLSMEGEEILDFLNTGNIAPAAAAKQLDGVQGGKFGVEEVDVKGAVTDVVDTAVSLAGPENERETRRDTHVENTVSQAASPPAAQSSIDPAMLDLGIPVLIVAVLLAFGLRRDSTIRRLRAAL